MPFHVAGTPLFRDLGKQDRFCSHYTPLSLSFLSVKWKWSAQLSLPTGLVENHMLLAGKTEMQGSVAQWSRDRKARVSKSVIRAGSSPWLPCTVVIQSGQSCFY